jgi:hypothetical protein
VVVVGVWSTPKQEESVNLPVAFGESSPG